MRVEIFSEIDVSFRLLLLGTLSVVQLVVYLSL